MVTLPSIRIYNMHYIFSESSSHNNNELDYLLARAVFLVCERILVLAECLFLYNPFDSLNLHVIQWSNSTCVEPLTTSDVVITSTPPTT